MDVQRKMKTTKYIIRAILVLAILIPVASFAQEGQVVDKIIAKVDDKIPLCEYH